MLKHFFVITIFFAFVAFMYGILRLHIDVEENACRMTYMFGIPQFSRVVLKSNDQYPRYALYYYYEGRLQNDFPNIMLKGAPVIFVPGNGGSYKQVRSLASVALRKSIDNDRNIHLDYFTIDYEEQLSGLYGGYLENQKQFLRLCILGVRDLYKKSSNVEKDVILIGHSMGGKIAEAVLEEIDAAPYINTIIYISTPLHNPVVNLDFKINEFYKNSDRYISTKRSSYIANIDTNICCHFNHSMIRNTNGQNCLNNILMVSIGGGNRDLVVRDGLTTSKYSDIHAMTSSIPNVWLSCDHLSAVWCLQLMIVINRFIFDVTNTDNFKNAFFVQDKPKRTRKAINYFVKPWKKYKSNDINFSNSTFNATWKTISKISYKRFFKDGLHSSYNLLLPMLKYKNYKKLYAEIDSSDVVKDWIYGCTATNFSNSIMCDKGISLSHNIENIATFSSVRSMVLIDLQHINNFYPKWTHILVRLHPTKKPITLKLDVYNKNERTLSIKAPSWFSFHQKLLINETMHSSIYYEINISDLTEPFPTVEFIIKPIACNDEDFNIAAKLCIPWARGFKRYSYIKQSSPEKSIYVNVPIPPPYRYNTSQNPIFLEIFLDPICRYQISYKFSIAGTMSRIVQELFYWIPSHITSVLFIVLKNQIVTCQIERKYACVKPFAGFLQYKSLYIITGCRIIKKLLLPIEFLPTIEKSEYSIYVSVIIHSTAIVATIVLVLILWTILTLHGNLLFKIVLRLTSLSVAPSNVLVQIFSVLPLSFGVLFISVAIKTCSGVALILSIVLYFILISNAYKDYLESWASEKIAVVLTKLPSKMNEHCGSNTLVSSIENTTNNHNENKDLTNQGLQNFSFHLNLLSLLFMMLILNFGVLIAWVQSYSYIGEKLPDPSLLPTIVVLSCLSILLQLDAPHKSSGNRLVSIVFYFCSCSCIIYCQEYVYRLNYLIAFIFVVVTLQEIINLLF